MSTTINLHETFVLGACPIDRLPRERCRGDRGEGVISTAIAVLVMAFLGAAMWVTFNTLWDDTAESTEQQVQIIGTDSTTPPATTP